MTNRTLMHTEHEHTDTFYEVDHKNSFPTIPAKPWTTYERPVGQVSGWPDVFPIRRSAAKPPVRRVFVHFGIDTSARISDDLFIAASRDTNRGITSAVAYLEEVPHVIDVSVDEDSQASEEHYTIWARTDVQGKDRRVLKAELFDWWHKNFAWLNHDVLLVVL